MHQMAACSSRVFLGLTKSRSFVYLHAFGVKYMCKNALVRYNMRRVIFSKERSDLKFWKHVDWTIFGTRSEIISVALWPETFYTRPFVPLSLFRATCPCVFRDSCVSFPSGSFANPEQDPGQLWVLTHTSTQLDHNNNKTRISTQNTKG